MGLLTIIFLRDWAGVHWSGFGSGSPAFFNLLACRTKRYTSKNINVETLCFICGLFGDVASMDEMTFVSPREP